MLCTFHGHVLKLYVRLGTNVEDMEDKLSPSIHYLQKLGPEYTETVFKGSRWIFEADRDMAFEESSHYSDNESKDFFNITAEL